MSQIDIDLPDSRFSHRRHWRLNFSGMLRRIERQRFNVVSNFICKLPWRNAPKTNLQTQRRQTFETESKLSGKNTNIRKSTEPVCEVSGIRSKVITIICQCRW